MGRPAKRSLGCNGVHAGIGGWKAQMEGLGGEGFVGTGVLLAHAESAKREALPTYGVDGHGYASISTKQRIFEKRPPSLRATRLLLLLLLMMPPTSPVLSATPADACHHHGIITDNNTGAAAAKVS